MLNPFTSKMTLFAALALVCASSGLILGGILEEGLYKGWVITDTEDHAYFLTDGGEVFAFKNAESEILKQLKNRFMQADFGFADEFIENSGIDYPALPIDDGAALVSRWSDLNPAGVDSKDTLNVRIEATPIRRTARETEIEITYVLENTRSHSITWCPLDLKLVILRNGWDDAASSWQKTIPMSRNIFAWSAKPNPAWIHGFRLVSTYLRNERLPVQPGNIKDFVLRVRLPPGEYSLYGIDLGLSGRHGSALSEAVRIDTGHLEVQPGAPQQAARARIPAEWPDRDLYQAIADAYATPGLQAEETLTVLGHLKRSLDAAAADQRRRLLEETLKSLQAKRPGTQASAERRR